MSYGLSLTTVPKDLYYVERKLVADQAAEIERLRSALKPFADVGGRYPNTESDDKEMYHSNLGRLTLGELPHRLVRNRQRELGEFYRARRVRA